MPGVGTTHHVKIGSDYHLILPGSYRKKPAPMFGARFATGDPDYNNLSFWQHWVQSCWVGGFGAETWMDDAMFDEGVGIDATQHEVMVLTRDLGPQTNRDASGNWDLDAADGARQREFIVFNNKLYCLSYGDADESPPSRLYGWNGTTWVLLKTFTTQAPSVAVFGDYLVFANRGANMERMDRAEAFTTFAKPAGGYSEPAYTMRVYRGKLYVPFGNFIFRLKSDFTWDGSTPFHTAVDIEYDNVTRSGFVHSDVHLGMLYLASSNGHVLRTDGNNTFDLWSFESGIKIASIRSFDGRLFVSVTEPLEGTTAQQAALYQFTGAAVTELKRWGKVSQDITTGRMRVYGRRLYFGAGSLLGMGSGFGIAAYDPVEDAYHLFGTNQDITTFAGGVEGILHTVDDVIFYGGYMWASVRGHGIFRTKFSFKDVTRYQAFYDTTAAGGAPGSMNGGWYVSSDFDAGTPGLRKLWNAVTVHIDLPNASTSFWMEYSLDGGNTWAWLQDHTGDGVTTRWALTFKLNDVISTRFKYRITLRTTDTTRSPQLRGVIVRYLPLPEPNWMWEMTLVLSERQELLDGTVEDPVPVATKIANLETAFRAQSPIFFEDVDGQDWVAGPEPGVIIFDYVKDLRHVGPSSDGPLEGTVRLTLLEAVEAY